MIFQPTGPETRLQNALRLLAEGQEQLAQHNTDLGKLFQAGHCVRAAIIAECELRERVAQRKRDVIWAQDRIRFGLDETGADSAILESSTTIDCQQPRSDEGIADRRMNRNEDGNAAAKGRRQAA